MLGALVNVILPVVLVACVGFVLARLFPIDIDSVNKVSLYGFTPALAYATVVTTKVSARDSLMLTGAYLAAMTLAAVVAVAAAHLLTPAPSKVSVGSAAGSGSGPPVTGEPHGTRRIVVGCTIIGNNGNFGLPIALLALGKQGLDQALVIFIASLLVMFTIGPALLGARDGLMGGIKRVLLLPVTWALVAALVMRGSGASTPAPLMSSIQLLADAAVPLVLLCLGLQLGQNLKVHLTRPVLVSVGLRVVVVPLAALLVGHAFGLSGLTLQSLVLACAMPTAVNAYMLAREFSDDPRTAASAVALSTFVSIPLIALVITLLPGL
ncbi:MAG: AEC family transporter [Micrococcales bacterium]|nr:AEC family transporter [Micrococcales bacterium]